MLEVPARKGFQTLTEAANVVVPSVALGFARSLDDGRVSVLYSASNGFGELVVPDQDVPEVLLPQTEEPRQADSEAINSHRHRAIEAFLLDTGVQRVVSLRIPAYEPATRFWIGLSDPGPLTPDQLLRLGVVNKTAAGLLNVLLSPTEMSQRQSRLEMAARLLPALLRVLDVREVFDRLSTTTRQALPHDLLILILFNEDLSTFTVYAQSDRGSTLGSVVPNSYPIPAVRAWSFDIVDDHGLQPLARDMPAIKMGARSSIRFPISFDDRVIGGLGFLSFEPARYSSADVAIGRRIADYAALALSHYQLAEESRKAAALQERAANLETLEGLLATLAGVLDIREVFDRVSAIARQVLPHDALSIVEIIENGAGARFHATHGLGDLPQPFDIPVPEPALVSEAWDSRLIDDIRGVPEFSRSPGLTAGMRSMLLVAIRVEGRLFGGLNFYSTIPGRYVQDDVLVARRICDHVALALSHRRLAEQARLNEELRARTANLELLDELLAALIDSGDLPDVFGRVSAIAGKVLPHDAVALMVHLPDGRRAHAYASSGFPVGPAPSAQPSVVDIPDEVLRDRDWEHDIFDDLSLRSEPIYAVLVGMGFRAQLRVAIRLDGRLAGALVFVSKAPSAFRQADILVARRIADRLAMTLARDREVEASNRADEATERATRLEARVRALTDELDARTGYRRVVGESPQWRQVLTQATQVAATEATVLLLGESGTGKEVIARFLHRASSRKSGPFIALNCAALPEQLLEAELFGYERGAYTGATQSKPGQLEQAAGGTLFLDEVGEMSPSAQAKFLRVLQEREFQRLGGTRILRTDARVVAATNRDLKRAIAQGQFREDLYYRLHVFPIRLPALRGRRDDILPLSEAFLGEIGRSLGRPPSGISRDARQMLLEYDWPGNVRELRNILERAAILCDGGLITADHLALDVFPTVPPPVTDVAPAPTPASAAFAAAAAPASSVPPSSAGDLETMERAMIEQALQTARFNKSKAAKALGLTRHQLYIRMRKYGFE